MITYELCLLLRILPKQELVTVLKRSANSIYEKGGIIRKLENLGTRDMPYKKSKHGMVHRQASYFMIEFNAPPSSIDDLEDAYHRDVDIVRRRIYKKNAHPQFDCTLSEELLPAPYRKNVQELIAEAKKNEKPKFKYNANLTYYPFQK